MLTLYVVHAWDSSSFDDPELAVTPAACVLLGLRQLLFAQSEPGTAAIGRGEAHPLGNYPLARSLLPANR
jgi:hypothetical protein